MAEKMVVVWDELMVLQKVALMVEQSVVLLAN